MVQPTAFVSRKLKSKSLLLTIASSLALLTVSPSFAAKKQKEDSKSADDKKKEEAKEEEPIEETPAEAEPAPAASASASTEATAAAASAGTPGGNIVFIDGGIRSDLGTLVQKSTVGGADLTDETIDVKAFGPLFHFGFLGRLNDHFRLGAAFGYGMNYTLVERLEKGDDNDPERYEMGQLLTADVRLEWNQHLAGPISLVVTPIVGITAIAVGGDLREATEAVDDSHHTRKGPRLGFIAGGDLGVRYQVNNWFSVKGAAGFSYTLQSLLYAKQNGEAADSKRVWRSSASRLNGLIALEANF